MKRKESKEDKKKCNKFSAFLFIEAEQDGFLLGLEPLGASMQCLYGSTSLAIILIPFFLS
jgi:hypothetical protein